MATIIKVTPETLVSVASTIENVAEDYQGQYSKIYEATSAMSASWSGKDNLAYTENINEFQQHLAEMYNLMKNYAAFLRTSAKSYAEAQDTITTQAKTLGK